MIILFGKDFCCELLFPVMSNLIKHLKMKISVSEYLNKHKLTFMHAKGLLNCFSLLTIKLLDKDSA